MNTHLAEEVIAELLREERHATNPISNGPWPVYVSMTPSTPDNVLALIGTDGGTEGRLHRTGETQGHEQFQLRVRGTTFEVAREKMLAIVRCFDSIVRYEIPVEDKLYLVQAVHRTTTPVYMGPDPNNRIAFTLNCITSITEVQP